MHVVIFECNRWRNFVPFTLSRPVFQLACGCGTLLEKQLRATKPSRITLWVRPGLADYCRQFVLPNLPCPGSVNTPLDDQPALLLNGRTLQLSDFEHVDQHFVIVDETSSKPILRQAYVRSPGLAPQDVLDQTDRWLHLMELPHSMARSSPQSRLPQYAWDLIGWNEQAITADFINRNQPPHPKTTGPYHLVQDSNIWLGQDVTLGPGCVLDGSKGPVMIADHASIGANAVLQGPCYIGPHTQVSPLAYIRAGTSVGRMCKVGGEISNTIILGYTNKPHDGFLGDSYVGEWVNFGAGSTTSNLKNTYSEISMPAYGKMIKTGRQFLGALVGDHTKMAIGTKLMTGSYIGYSCMIATTKYPPRIVPSYTFLTDTAAPRYRMDKAEQTMKASFHRRNRSWTTADEQINQYIAETAPLVEKVLLPEKPAAD